MSLTDVPIPPRMAHLPRDPRGYPIPVIVLVDDSGRPNFAPWSRSICVGRCPNANPRKSMCGRPGDE